MKIKFQIIISSFLLCLGVLHAETTPESAKCSNVKDFKNLSHFPNDTIPDSVDSLSFLVDSLFNVSFPNEDLPPSPPPPKGETLRALSKTNQDTIPNQGFDSRNLPPNQVAGGGSPLGAGGAGSTRIPDLSEITISEESVEQEVEYDSQDSMFFDTKNKQIHLYGQAVVKYQTMTIEAEYIMIDWNDNTILADGRKVLGKTIGSPRFTEGDQKFGSSKMKYNFKTEKGIIYDATSQQEGMQVISRKAKYISSKDSLHSDVIYGQGAIFTTCQHSEPHFGVRSRKQKVVPEKVAVVGPSNIEIMGIPTPLVLPFGFFPLKQGQRTGLIFPQGYEFSERFGFGLERVGWYFPFNDQWDLQLTGDIYFKGTFRIHANSRYKKRYKYGGSLNLDLAYLRNENAEGRLEYSPSYAIRWTHNQDSKAHPTRTFRGSVNIQANSYQQQNEFDAASQLAGSLSSNVSLSFQEVGPFRLSTSFQHSQNTRNGEVRIQFPNLSAQARTMYPFKRKNKTGPSKWFEEISLDYNSEFRNEMRATDTTLFTSATINDAKFGMRHNLSSRVNFNVLKYFNLSPNVNYKEVWYLKSVEKYFDPTVLTELDTTYNPLDSTDFEVTIDTTQAGKVEKRENFGFESFREYTVGVNLTTKIFGTLLFKKGKLRGLRHIITPRIGFNFSPDYTDPSLGYYRDVQSNLENTETLNYTIFENGIFGRPSSSGRRMSLDFGFTNDFEAKYYSKKDSTDKKLTIFRGFSVRSSYNFAADSLKFSQVRMNGSTNFFNNMTSVNINLLFDPYAPKTPDNHTSRINTYWKDVSGKPLRFVEASFTLTTGLTIKRIRDLFKGVNSDNLTGNAPGSGAPPPPGGQAQTQRKDGLLDLFESTNIRHNLRVKYAPDTVQVTAHTISLTAGRIPITDNWNVQIGNIGYDFTRNRLTYPDFSFSRDLHCWEMGVRWVPAVSVYNFYLRVKPGRLDFIKIPYGRNQQDTFRGF